MFRAVDPGVLKPISNPPNPWSTTEVEYLEEAPPARLEVYQDHTREILSHNDSPDVGFSWSVNPYRGCFHACSYCYARPSHEYLGFGAGTDFDRKITVKPEAPRLLREAFERPSWKGELIVFSGVTDCYQPLEASYRLTRGCLEVCAEYRNPAGIITKSPLIERDLDVLQALAKVADVGVTVSIPLWDREHAHAVEQRLREKLPLRAERVLARVREARGGKLYDSRWAVRGRGEGRYAEAARALFESTARRAGLATGCMGGDDSTTFRRPDRPGRQLPLL